MSEVHLAEAKVLLVDFHIHSRRLLRDALHMIGFREIEAAGRPKDVRPVLDRYDPHLVFVDVDTNHESMCEIIRMIRHQKLGPNPFVTIIALTGTPDRVAVESVLSSGTDDMIAKPISPRIIRDRVLNLIDHRKDFVASTTYFGPDRRSGRRSTSERDLPPITVPNALRHATVRGDGQQVDEAQIRETMRSLCKQKVYQLAWEISHTAAGLYAAATDESRQDGPDIVGACGSLGNMFKQIEKLIAEQEFGNIRQITKNARQVLNKIGAAGLQTKPRQFELLHTHAQAIMVTLRESDQAGGVLASALSEAKMAVNA
ncbi:MAG: response regulator [Alphaproteobacteria bacterium]|nr:response regulator [Alphaproteobacteria bacterium]